MTTVGAPACPGCGSVLPEALDDRPLSFCPGCDYPLLFAARRLESDGNRAPNDIDDGTRRLPGADGRVVPNGEPCPACAEVNVFGATYCHRCGAAMHPLPTVVVAPETTTAVVPPPPERDGPGFTIRIGPLHVVVVLAVVMLIQIAVVLAR